MFFDSLLQEVEAAGCGVALDDLTVSDLAFADDLALVSGSVADANAQLAVVHRHSQKWRYELNAAKSAVAVVGTPSQEAAAREASFMLGNEKLQLDDDYPYLGIIFSALRGKPKAFIEQRIASAKLKAPMLSGAGGARFNGIQPHLGYHLWTTLIRPGLEWGAEVTVPTSTMLQQLDAVQAAFLRTCTGTDTFTG